MAVESFSTSSIAFGDVTPRRTSRRSHALFEALQKEIVLGSLHPEQALTEMDLAQRFACSQGTVREALMRLAEEGLVNRQPNRGTRVAPCQADDARALLHIRREVECGFLDRVVANADASLAEPSESVGRARADRTSLQEVSVEVSEPNRAAA